MYKAGLCSQMIEDQLQCSLSHVSNPRLTYYVPGLGLASSALRALHGSVLKIGVSDV